MVAATFGSPAHATEQIGTARFEILLSDAVNDCPSEAELVRRVRATTKEQAPEAGAEPLALSVSIVREETAFVARLRVEGRHRGEREIQAQSCAALGDALVVTLAMLLDEHAREAQASAPTTVTAPVQPAPAAPVATDEVPATPVAAVETPPPPPPAPEAASAPRRLRAVGWLAGGISTARMESLLGGVEVGSDGVALRAGGWWRLPYEYSLEPGRIASRIVGGVLAGCATRGERVRLGGCAQVWSGALHTEALGYSRQRERPDRLWLAPGASVGVEWGHRWVVGLELVGLVPVLRDRYQIANVEGSWDAGLPAGWLLTRLGMANR